MSALVRKLAVGAGLLALTATTLATPASAQFGGREELATGNATIRIAPESGGTSGAGFTPGSGGENRVGQRTFKIVRVTPLQGQNPLNQESPALNFNNQTFDNATELQDAAEGNDDGNDLAGADNCSGNGINSAIENFGVDFAFAGINLDSNTGDCVLRNDGEGPFLIFQFPGSGAGGTIDTNLDIFPDALVAEFTLINPPPNAGSGVNVAFGSFVFTLRAINGNEFDVTFTVTKLDGNEVGGVVVNPSFRLDVTSIVQTN